MSRPRPVPAGRPGLPTSLTTFVGRRAELAALRDLLAEARLLTLIGPGGCGKTRLAVELANTVGDGYPDGVYFVDLAPVTESADVENVVARALGLGEDLARAPAEVVAAHMRTARALVMLDNCEHLVDPAAVLASYLLSRCPQLTVLATSRSPLDLAGEICWRVPSLSLPPVEVDTMAGLRDSEAVALLLDRAHRVRPEWTPTDADAPGLARICHELDGIPLALELAAARMRVFSPARIAAELSDQMRFLVGSGRGTSARQRTLRASLSWSHDLLTDPERALFRRLAPFAGTFDVAAATDVGSGQDLSPHQVLDMLCLLVDKSVLTAAETADGRTVFRLQETVRQYAAELLATSGEEAATRDRHRDHYRALARELAAAATGKDQDAALDRLTADLANLRAAYLWCLTRHQHLEALEFAVDLYPLWRMRGRRLDGAGWLDEALAATSEQPDGTAGAGWKLVRTRGLVARARLGLSFTADDADRIDEAVRLARTVADPELLVRALTAGGGYLVRGTRAHLGLLEEARAAAVELRDEHLALDVEAWHGIMTMIGGDPPAALRSMERTCERLGATRNWYLHRVMTGMTGLAQLMLGEVEAARPRLVEAATKSRAVDDRFAGGYMRALLGWALAQGGDPDPAAAEIADSLASVHAGADSAFLVLIRWAAGMAALATGDAAEATGHFKAGRAATGGAYGWTDLFTGPGAEAALAAGDLDGARTLSDEAVTRVSAGDMPWQEGWARCARARVARVDGQLARAEDLAYAALAVRLRINDIAGAADVLELLAQIAAEAGGRDAEAARLFGAADAARHRAGCVRWGVHTDIAASIQAIRGLPGGELAWADGQELSLAEAAAYAARGRGERGRPAAGWESLTPTEREVVGLVADRLSNKEIAGRMFISPRTVQTHLTHAYAKLGLTGRVALAQEVIRHRDQSTS